MSNSKDNLNRSDIESSLIKEFPDLTKAQISKSIDVIINSIVEAVAVKRDFVIPQPFAT